MRRACVLLTICLASCGISAFTAADSPSSKGVLIRLDPTGTQVKVRITGLSKDDLSAGSKRLADAVAVYVDRGPKAEQLAMLGTTKVEKGAVVFEPRFPLIKGVPYRVVFTSPSGGKNRVETMLSLPKPAAKATTVVSRIYPTADRLPENQLKFYLHFSAPMKQGESYRHIRLLDAKGKQIELPFLELDQELWDPDSTRFTLFFDPGRIKRGLKPREEVGPALEEGKSYTLVIDRAWLDAEGNVLKEGVKKAFRVGAPDDTPPDVKTWKLRSPTPGTRETLRVTMPKSMDHALLHRLVWVTDAAGTPVDGKVDVSDRETIWSFTPDRAWAAGKYNLVADTRLEDLSGNSLGRPFEVDVLRPVERKIKTDTVKVPFEVKKP